MALSLTNLKANFDFSDASKLWKFYQAGTPYHNTPASDGDALESIDDVQGNNVSLVVTSSEPIWRSGASSPMERSSIQFDGTRVTNAYDDAVTGQLLSSYFAATTAHTSWTSLYITAVTTNNTTTPYLNDTAWGAEDALYGLHFRFDGTDYWVQASTYDGGAQFAETQFPGLNQSFWVRERHDGTNIYISVNGGAEVSAAAGARVGSGSFRVGAGYAATTKPMTGYIGELAFYDTNVTGTAQSDNDAWFAGRWLAAAAGITFDAAANSGSHAVSANYTFNRTVTAANSYLSVNVELLTVTGATVTSVTDDDGVGNNPLTLIGARTTITGAGRVECWGRANPAAGTKAIRVILSAAVESGSTAQVHGGVHQTSPVEGFNSAQATNAGSPTNASVVITSVADNCWPVAACVADDTSITANQTTRNNISGTAGSGADEDTGAAVTPAGATTMSYSGMGIAATWVIAGYALRPVAAASFAGGGPIYGSGSLIDGPLYVGRLTS